MEQVSIGKVSVIIPTYKRPKELKRAIFSVINQTYQNVEVIVVDDNNDGDEYRKETESLMSHIQSNAKVKYVKHHRNQNGSAARNTGILSSNGEYISFLDDDDFFLKDRLSHDISIIKDMDDSYGGICSGYVKVFKNSIYKKGTIDSIDDSCYKMLSGQTDYAAGSTLMIRRNIISKLGLFDTSFNRHQDWEFLVRLLSNYKLITTSNIGVVICTDGIRNVVNTQKLLSAKHLLINTYSDILHLLPKPQINQITKYQRKEVLYNFFKEGRVLDAYRYYKIHLVGDIEFEDYKYLLYFYVACKIPLLKRLTILLLGVKNRAYNYILEENKQ